MEHVRTHTRDGGGAYLLLDGSRAMTGTLDLGNNYIINTKDILPKTHLASSLGNASLWWKVFKGQFLHVLGSITSFVADMDIIAGDISGGSIRLRTEFGGTKIVLDAHDGQCDIPLAGDIIFTGGGLCYGGISVDNNAVGTLVADQDTWVQVTVFDTDDAENNADADHTNDHIVIEKAGKYLVVASITAQSAVSQSWYFGCFINDGDTELDNLEAERQTSVANKPGSISLSGIVDLAVDDTLELWVQRTTGGDPDQTILVTHATMSLIQIGS